MPRRFRRLKSWNLAILVWIVCCIQASSQIQTFQSHPAERVTVVKEGGGYFPVLCRLSNGDLVAVLRGGGPHKYSWGKARLDLVRSTDSGRSWSKPETLVDTPMDDLNPSMGQLSDGTLVVGYWSYKGSMESTSHEAFKSGQRKLIFLDSHFSTKRSKDAGLTWDEPIEFAPPVAGIKKGSPHGKIVEINRVALMAFYVENKEGYDAYLLRSRDRGKTWVEPTLIARQHNETVLAVLPKARLAAILRTDSGSLSLSYSEDQGLSWSQPQSLTGKNEHPGDLLVLPGGQMIVAYGNRNPPFGVRALITSDGGKSWDKKSTLNLAWDAPNRDCGYPSSVLLDDGSIVTIYYQVNDLETAPQSAQCRAVIWKPPLLPGAADSP